MVNNQPRTGEKIQSPSPQSRAPENKKQDFNKDTKLPYNKDNKSGAESDGK